MKKQIQKWVEEGLISSEKANAIIEYNHNENADFQKKLCTFLLYFLALVSVVSFTGSMGHDGIPARIYLTEVVILSVFAHFLGREFKSQERKNSPLSNFFFFMAYALTILFFFVSTIISDHNNLFFPLCIIVFFVIAYIHKNNFLNGIATFALFFAILGIDKLTTLSSAMICWFAYGISLFGISYIPIIHKKYNSFSITYRVIGIILLLLQIILLGIAAWLHFVKKVI